MNSYQKIFIFGTTVIKYVYNAEGFLAYVFSKLLRGYQKVENQIIHHKQLRMRKFQDLYGQREKRSNNKEPI